jgi:hypothetical protein
MFLSAVLLFLLMLCFQGGDEDARGLRCWCDVGSAFFLVLFSVRSRWFGSVFLESEGDGWCICLISPHTHGFNCLGFEYSQWLCRFDYQSLLDRTTSTIVWTDSIVSACRSLHLLSSGTNSRPTRSTTMLSLESGYTQTWQEPLGITSRRESRVQKRYV